MSVSDPPAPARTGSLSTRTVHGGCFALLLWLPLMFASLVTAQPQGDDPDQRGYELYMHGERLYAAGNYEGAVQSFVESYELTRRPLLLYNIANAYERMAQYENAIAALERYLPHAPEAEQALTHERIDVLRKRQAASEEKAQAPPEQPDVQLNTEAGSQERPRWILKWATLGAGAAFTVAGVTVVWLGELDHRQIIDDKHKPASSRLTTAELHELNDSGDTKKLTGYIAGGAGLTLLATSTALFLLDRHDKNTATGAVRARRVSFRPLRGGGALVSVSGQF